MKNITLAVDKADLERARVVAARKKTTINAMVRGFIKEIGSEEDRAAKAKRDILDLIGNTKFRIGSGWTFDRDEAHER